VGILSSISSAVKAAKGKSSSSGSSSKGSLDQATRSKLEAYESRIANGGTVTSTRGEETTTSTPGANYNYKYTNGGQGSTSGKNTLSYGSGGNYGNRATYFTWETPQGTKTSSSNATNYPDAAKEAGIDLNTSRLASASSYYDNNGKATAHIDGYNGAVGGTGIWNKEGLSAGYASALAYEKQLADKYGMTVAGVNAPIGQSTNIAPLPSLAETIASQNSAQHGLSGGAGNIANNNNAYANNNNAYGNNSYSNPYEENPYSELLKKSQRSYNDMEDQIAAMNAASTKQGVNRLENQRSGINSTYEDSAKQAYINYLRQQYQMPETLAAQGINGGATETASLGLTNNYNTSLNSINNEKSKAITDLDNSIIDLKNTGDLQTAQQVLENSQSALSAYQSLMQSAISQNNWQTEFNYNANRDSVSDRRYNQEYTDSRSDLVYQRQIETDTSNYNKAFSMAQLGYSNQQIAEALGMSLNDLQSMTNRINESNDLALKSGKLAYQQQVKDYNTSKISTKSSGSGSRSSRSSGSSGKSSNGGNKPKLSAAQTVAAIEDGIDSDTVRKAYEYYQFPIQFFLPFQVGDSYSLPPTKAMLHQIQPVLPFENVLLSA